MLDGKTQQKTPTKTELKEIQMFWKSVWEDKGSYQLDHPAIAAWKEDMREQSKPMPDDSEPLDREEAWTKALKKLTNWTAPGPDGIPGYWLKVFNKTINHLKRMYWEILDQTTDAPSWLVRGRTVLIPKEGCEGKPEQFRPITCLNTSYKLLTGTMSQILTKYVMDKEILPEEQKALRKGRRGCLDALIIDEAAAIEAKLYRKNLSVAWIDYRKAFDMIPHKLVRIVLKSIRASKS